ncbi:Nuclear transport factor 2, partial [Linum grandiflorum]
PYLFFSTLFIYLFSPNLLFSPSLSHCPSLFPISPRQDPHQNPKEPPFPPPQPRRREKFPPPQAPPQLPPPPTLHPPSVVFLSPLSHSVRYLEQSVMAELVQQPVTPTADVVGNAFVHQYYHILRQSPELVHRFYQDNSKLGRPEGNGIMSITTTMLAINEKILALVQGDFKVEILTVDSQESYEGGVLVLVTGYLTRNDDLREKFTQSFFLAPQENGYFVLNDVFRYVDEVKVHNGDPDTFDDVKAPATAQEDSSLVTENHVPEPVATLSVEVNEVEVHDSAGNGDAPVEEEEVPVPEVIDAAPEVSERAIDPQVVSQSDTKIEDAPKKSYASIVKVMKENAAPFSAPAASPLRSVSRNQEQFPASAPPPQVSEPHPLNSNEIENQSTQDTEAVAEGPSIYVKGLPFDATPALLENEFKKFGTIRAGGIQIRNQKGFCFGFVEFEAASAVQSAIEASPVMIHGWRVVVEEKRSTFRGNSRGRSTAGPGSGYRNDGVRGRGGYGGGRSYGRGSGGSVLGTRTMSRGGGFSNRGGEGFHRSDKTTNNNGGGRTSRSGGPPMNVAGSTAPHVSATA